MAGTEVGWDPRGPRSGTPHTLSDTIQDQTPRTGTRDRPGPDDVGVPLVRSLKRFTLVYVAVTGTTVREEVTVTTPTELPVTATGPPVLEVGPSIRYVRFSPR